MSREESIQELAYSLYMNRLANGVDGTAESDWLFAESTYDQAVAEGLDHVSSADGTVLIYV